MAELQSESDLPAPRKPEASPEFIAYTEIACRVGRLAGAVDLLTLAEDAFTDDLDTIRTRLEEEHPDVAELFGESLLAREATLRSAICNVEDRLADLNREMDLLRKAGRCQS